MISLKIITLTISTTDVLWIDTEQSIQSTKEILTDRIVPLVDMEQFPDGLYDIINIRLDSWEERLKLVLGAATIYPMNR